MTLKGAPLVQHKLEQGSISDSLSPAEAKSERSIEAICEYHHAFATEVSPHLSSVPVRGSSSPHSFGLARRIIHDHGFETAPSPWF